MIKTPAVMVPNRDDGPKDITDAQWPKNIDHRDQWSRWRVRKMLAKVYSRTSDDIFGSLPKEIQKLLPDVSSDDIPAQNIPELPEFNPQDTIPPEIKVCIIGAGAAGLFTAMILDWLKEKGKRRKLPELNISYDILEANSEDRLGGRLYTYKFPPTTVYTSGQRKKKYTPGDYDYYDVGAMRFPDIPIMKRTFDLFKYLGLEKKSGNNHGKLIPYYMKHENNPSYFNDIHYIGDPPASNPDPYDMRSQTGAKIPDDILKDGPTKTLLKAIKVYRDTLANNPEKGWKMLMDVDKFSTRDFLMLPALTKFKTVEDMNVFQAAQDIEPNPIGGPGYNFNTVEWLETFGVGTRSYSQAFSETVLGSLAFHYPKKDSKDSVEPDDLGYLEDTTGSKNDEWWCIDGGANVLAQEMAKKITGKIQFNNPVTSIALDQTHDTHNITVGVNDDIVSHKYAAVFNSTTLGALQRMKLTAAGLNLGTKQAIRTLNYGASCKVGIWFSRPWWIQSPYNIRGGLGKTDLPIRVCVYPSYNLPEDENPDDSNKLPPKELPPKELPPAVLLCSYTWEQDASRLGSMITKNSPEGEELLKKVLFDNLARLHASPPEHPYEEVYKAIKETYIAHHAYNWYQDQHSAGAFAFFGPYQFKEVWPDLTAPSADGKLFIIGEAASSHHAWVVGALESALRGVYQFLARYAQLYPQYQEVIEYLENTEEKDIEDEDRPFLPLPLSFEKKMAKHQVVVSQARANGMKDRL